MGTNMPQLKWRVRQWPGIVSRYFFNRLAQLKRFFGVAVSSFTFPDWLKHGSLSSKTCSQAKIFDNVRTARYLLVDTVGSHLTSSRRPTMGSNLWSFSGSDRSYLNELVQATMEGRENQVRWLGAIGVIGTQRSTRHGSNGWTCQAPRAPSWRNLERVQCTHSWGLSSEKLTSFAWIIIFPTCSPKHLTT